eukprot:scaffold1486_cov314-Pavlova_lutheri.AAC.3
MDSDGQGDQDTLHPPPVSAERYPYAGTFRERVRCHDAYDKEHAMCIRPLKVRKRDVLVLVERMLHVLYEESAS